MRALLSFLAALAVSSAAAQSSDSLFRQQMEEYGIRFTEGNDVKLLMSGQAKFDDMFQAIRQARHSVHLEYFNFRNDSIASMLFDILREKRREGVEVRALFDGFGNDSNNQPLKKQRNITYSHYVTIVSASMSSTPYVSHGLIIYGHATTGKS